jgi:hypothetical protein
VSDAVYSYRVDDAATLRYLETRGSRVRDAATSALVRVTREALNAARSAAPTARTAAGVMAYGTEQENKWNERGSGSGMPREMSETITRTLYLNAKGALTTTIANTYYLGRFREEGFSGEVDVRAHTRRAKGRKSWALRSGFRKAVKALAGGETSDRAIASKAKAAGWNDRAIRLIYKGGQVAVDFHKRKHRVRRTQFMPNEADMGARLKAVADAALREALQ